MREPKSSAIDGILSSSIEPEDHRQESAAGRRPSTRPGKALPRGSQAWRSIEDMQENRRLDRKLKEVYEEN